MWFSGSVDGNEPGNLGLSNGAYNDLNDDVISGKKSFGY